MHNFWLISFVLVLVLLNFQVNTLFANTPYHNFMISGYFSVAPNKVVLDGTGTKFVAWNSRNQIGMFGTNGYHLCDKNLSRTIKQVIWPDYYAPIILMDEGQEFATFSQFSCTIIKSYDIQVITGVSGQKASFIAFTRSYNAPIVTVTGVIAAYEINLDASFMTNLYATMDPSIPIINQALYSDPNTASNIYFSMVDKYNNSFVRVWETKWKKAPFLRQISFNDTIIEAMMPSMNYPYVVTQGSTLSDPNSTLIQLFQTYGKPVNKIIRRKTGDARLITDGNIFDAVVFSDIQKYSFQVFSVDNGVRLQNIRNTQIYDNFCIDYRNRVLIIIDSARRVMTYNYENDSADNIKQLIQK